MDVEVVLETVANMVNNIGGEQVRLVGYAKEFLRALRGVLEDPRGEEQVEAAKLRWDWEGEDGEVVCIEVSNRETATRSGRGMEVELTSRASSIPCGSASTGGVGRLFGAVKDNGIIIVEQAE